MNQILNSSELRGHSMPTFESGALGTAGALAIKESLSLGSVQGVADVLNAMSVRDMAAVLREVGFSVSPGMEDRGASAVLAAVSRDMKDAIRLRVDGYDLAAAREVERANSFAAKDLEGEAVGVADSAGALDAIQAVMRFDSVQVSLLGQADVGDRASLTMIAAQAMQKGVLGFGFDGVAGKYQVPLSMHEVVSLHGAAARDSALAATRGALKTWVEGARVGEISDVVPDSVQRLLHGSISVDAASAIVNAIEDGMIGKSAMLAGEHRFGRLLSNLGIDVNAKTVEAQAGELGLVMVKADMERGRYFGPVVGEDHRAALVKYARDKAVDMPYAALKEGQERPRMGDMVNMRYAGGKLEVGVARDRDQGVGGR